MTADHSGLERRSLLGVIGAAVGTGLAGCAGDQSPNPGSDGGSSLTLPSVVTSGDLPAGQVELIADGTVTLLNFFATWCKPCVDEMPHFRRLRAAYDADTLHMVSITPEVDEDLIEAFWTEHDGTWPVVTDPALKATQTWNANSYPTNLLFDRNGEQVTDGGHGLRVRDFEGLQAEIEPLIEDSA